ncbi:FAD binding domain containing protein [Sclerotinia borealis F-4128]|uniref:FAD binding domain containing protein n=1 Tax=Sclerotinia borealis (strain F-4128) TaxID=1432307 RepID=W9CF98_SCLBF|nr:FAD binding domain containing protein [Sclerotinia borealis F-4128]
MFYLLRTWKPSFLLLCIASCCASDDLTALTSTCNSLSSLLPGKVFFPGSVPYNASLSGSWYLDNRLTPICFVKPQSASDVSSAVKVLKNSPSIQFAVRGGGHAFNPRFSGIDKGVTIDMSAMNTVDVIADRFIASVGAGAVWSEVFNVLDTYNQSALGGRVSDVGVGGLITGGGLAFFSPQRGFAADSVANFQVVLSTGDIVNANATSNADLFAALKGGQNNFGIVTRFDIITFSQGPFWGGTLIFPNSTDDQQIKAFTSFKTPANYDPYTSVEQSHVYVSAQNNTFLTSSSIYYSKPVVNASSLKVFTDIQPQIMNTLRISNVSDFAEEVKSLGTPNQYSVWATTTFEISPTILTKVLAAFRSSRLQIGAEVDSVVSSMTWQSIPPPPSNPLTPNSMGFSPSSTPQKNLVMVLISDFWTDPASEALIRASLEALVDSIDSISQDEGKFVPYKYLNYAADFQDPLSTTGRKPLQQTVARKYDRAGMFQTQVPGGFKFGVQTDDGKDIGVKRGI